MRRISISRSNNQSFTFLSLAINDGLRLVLLALFAERGLVLTPGLCLLVSGYRHMFTFTGWLLGAAQILLLMDRWTCC